MLARRWLRRLGYGGGVVGVALLVGLGVWYWPGSQEAGDASSASSARAKQAHWKVGEQRDFALRMESRVEMEGQPLLDAELRGTWRVVRLANDAKVVAGSKSRGGHSGLRLAARFEPSDVTIAAAPEEAEAVVKALEEQVYIHVSSRGLAAEIAFGETSDRSAARDVARGMLRTMASAFQVARPPQGQSGLWTSQEADQTGRYVAEYRRAGPGSVDKSKQRYIATAAQQPVDATTSIQQSRIALGFRRDTLALEALETLDLQERTRVQSQGPLPELSSELNLKLGLEGEKRLASPRLSQLAAGAASATFYALHDRSPEQQAAVDRSKLQGAGFEETLQELEKLLQDGKAAETSRRAKLYARLSAHLRFDEGKVEQAAERIRQDESLRGMLIDALGDAGSAAAQEALRELYDDPGFPREEQRRILLALSFGEAASEETVAFLHELEHDEQMGEQARYGLGTSAYYLQQAEPERATEVVDALAGQLDSASDYHDIVTYLKALGNSAHSNALPAIEPFLSHENAGIRAAALDAMRRIPGRKVDQYVARGIAKDESVRVRKASVRTLKYRSASPALVYALRDRVSAEPDSDVRREVVSAAIRWKSDAPVLQDALAQAVQSEQDETIRELITRAL